MKKIILFLTFLCALLLPNIKANATTIGKVTDTTKEGLNVRVTPNGTLITQIGYGTEVTILGSSGNWYQVIYDGINTGYVSKNYISVINDYIKDDVEYCTSLINAGFDSSYCPYLNYLHSVHPTWTFTAEKINASIDEAASHEALSNGLQTLIPAYQLNGNQIDTGYYFINQSVIKYYMDPRNFLAEKSIFMFENISYEVEKSKDYYRSLVLSLLKDTWLTESKYDDNPNGDLIDAFVEAGYENHINPANLAVRLIQEGARNVSFIPVSGNCNKTFKNVSLLGYYNFYNIGAYHDSKYPELTAQERGVAYAAGLTSTLSNANDRDTSYNRPWTTRTAGIQGGAKFIASQYVNQGQNTIYYEKFNVSPNTSNDMYDHQYQTNIASPLSEAIITYNNYNEAGIVNSAINFVIPVYKNMGTTNYKMPSVSNNNTYLDSLTVNGASVSGFDKDILSYTVYLKNTVTTANIVGVASASSSTISGNTTIDLNTTSSANVTVTAQNGETRVYTINIVRVTDTVSLNDIVSNISATITSNIMKNISNHTNITTMQNQVAEKSPNATIVIKTANGTIKNSGIFTTGDFVTITNAAGESATYQVAVKGDINGDNNITLLDLLKVQKHLLGTGKLSGVYYEAADTNNDGQITLLDLLKVQKHLLGKAYL